MIRKLLHLFSYLFSGGLSLFLIGLAVIALADGAQSFQLDMISQWTGAKLAKVLLAGCLLGLGATALAACGRLRFLFPIWALVVFAMIVYGFFLSSYQFAGIEDFRSAIYLACGQLVTVLG